MNNIVRKSLEISLSAIACSIILFSLYYYLPLIATPVAIFHFFFGFLCVIMVAHYKMFMKTYNEDDVSALKKIGKTVAYIPYALSISARYIPMGVFAFLTVLKIHNERIQTQGVYDD